MGVREREEKKSIEKMTTKKIGKNGEEGREQERERENDETGGRKPNQIPKYLSNKPNFFVFFSFFFLLLLF